MTLATTNGDCEVNCATFRSGSHWNLPPKVAPKVWEYKHMMSIPGSSIWCPFLPLLRNTRISRLSCQNCQPRWCIFAVWSGVFAVWSGMFAAEKRAWQRYIRRNTGLPKKSSCAYLLGKRQKLIKPTSEEAGIKPLTVCTIKYMYVLYIYILYIQ